jgi:hypothetical protein
MANEPAPVSAHEDPAGRRLVEYGTAWAGAASSGLQMLAPGELGAAEVAALCWLDPDFEPEPGYAGDCYDPGHGPDAEPEAEGGEPTSHIKRYEFAVAPGDPVGCWEVLPDAVRRQLPGMDRDLDGLDAADPGEDEDDRFEDLIEAGFTHHYPVPDACGFRAGGPLDVMLPGSELAWFTGGARQRGLSEFSDDELIGLMGAARRVQSWQAELELAATAELDARRAQPDGREGEHVAEELAAALTLTGRAALAQLELSRQMERLPHTAGLLAAGIIDRPRAAVIASHLCLLNDIDAAAVDAKIAPKAAGMTTGQLSAKCHSAVVAHDPLAYLRRKKEAEKDARVECWTEDAGTAALAGRDLDRAATIAADKSIDAAARLLRRQGAWGTLDQLRAAVFQARVNEQPVHAYLPAPPAGANEPAADDSGSPAGTPADGPGTTPADADTRGRAFPAVLGAPAAPGAGSWPPASGGSAGLGPGALPWVQLTMPAISWLGVADRPGEITGTGAAGPADAETCRQLADALARDPATRWCITLTDRAGRAVAHGCARAGPGPPGSDRRTWLATVKITPIETATCSHRYESAGYQPGPTLRHRVKIRSPRCGFPGCRRAARRCDDDHTIPYDQGGRTCECNLYPLCRHHHQCKQADGWHLAQPTPGVLVWTAPSGRTYTTTAEPYPV